MGFYLHFYLKYIWKLQQIIDAYRKIYGIHLANWKILSEN